MHGFVNWVYIKKFEYFELGSFFIYVRKLPFFGESNKNPRLCRGNQGALASGKNLLCYNNLESAKTQESIGGFLYE